MPPCTACADGGTLSYLPGSVLKTIQAIGVVLRHDGVQGMSPGPVLASGAAPFPG
jgi:hypothetical protein